MKKCRIIEDSAIPPIRCRAWFEDSDGGEAILVGHVVPRVHEASSDKDLQ